MKTNAKAELGTLTPYEIRKYNAVIYGYQKARAIGVSAARRLWKSRRHWQERAIEAEQRLELIEWLAVFEEAMQPGDGPKGARLDLLNHALDPDQFERPADWERVLKDAPPTVRRRNA